MRTIHKPAARAALRLALAAAAAFASLTGSAANATPAPTSPDPRAVARVVDAYANPLIERGELSGQLLIARHGRIVLERSFGMADVELGTPVTPETRFNVASVTKPMTGVIAIQLIQEHRLELRDSITRWFPGFPSGDSITVSDLLRHRSGIPHQIIPDSEMTRPISAGDVVERARRLPLDFSPGTRESYSSGGYEVLARILELASGRSYARLLQERIFDPLEMSHSAHVDSRELMPGRACGYVPGAHGIENAPLQDLSGLVGAGSVWSTARDLHRFVQGVVEGKLGEGPRQSYVRQGRVDFNGRTGGFKAWAMWDSAGGLEVIFVGNNAGGGPDALKRDILQLAAGISVTPPSPPRLRTEPLPAAELRRWEGEFQIEHGPHLSLRVRDGVLYSNDWVMLPAADGAMYSPRDYGVVRAVADTDGTIRRLDWTQGTATYPAVRTGP